jgi:hypothetical protein
MVQRPFADSDYSAHGDAGDSAFLPQLQMA